MKKALRGDVGARINIRALLLRWVGGASMAVPDRCYHCGRRSELEQHAVYDAEIAHLGDGWRQRVENRRRDVYHCGRMTHTSSASARSSRTGRRYLALTPSMRARPGCGRMAPVAWL